MGAPGRPDAGPERGGPCSGGPGVGCGAAPACETRARQTHQATYAGTALGQGGNGLVARIATSPSILRSAPGAGTC